MFCNMVTLDCLRVGIARQLSIPESAIKPVIENETAPLMEPDVILVASYVDNGNIIAPTRARAAAALQGFLAELRRRNLVYHEVVEPTQHITICGALFDFATFYVMPSPARAWRLYSATRELAEMGGSTPAAVQIYLGHLVHHFMLLRPALAAVDLLYGIAHRSGRAFTCFSPDTIAELRTIKGLIFLAGVQLNLPWAEVAYCSDACLSDYAVSEAQVSYEEAASAGLIRER